MSRRDDLIALRDAVQAGETPTNDMVWNALSEHGRIPILGLHVLPAFKGSVDAALAFLAAALPGWFWTRQGFVMTVTDDHTGWGSKPHFSARDDQNPARALLLATLNALIAEADT